MNIDPMQQLRVLAEQQATAAAGRALAERIRQMARRWGYGDVELAEALTLAEADPAGWLRLVECDERIDTGPGIGQPETHRREA